MVRVLDFKIDDDTTVKLAAMTWLEAEKFQEETQGMLARKDEVKPDEWISLTLRTICASIKKAATIRPPQNASTNGDYSAEDLKKDFDMPTLNAMYFKVLEISGLRAEIKS